MTVADPAGLRQHGRSKVVLPSACDVPEIDVPGAVRLTRDDDAERTADGGVTFTAETAALDVGVYKQTISCGGEQVEVTLFVYRQIGGARGEANSINRLAALGGLLTLVLVGAPNLAARRKGLG